MSSGVFNFAAHQAEIQSLLKGKFRQYQAIGIALDTAGIVKTTGGDQGWMETEGNGLLVLSSYANKDRTILTSFPGVPIYVQFNHPDNEFLPIGIPDSTQTTVQPWPSAYALTIGRMKFLVPASSVNANKVIYLLVVKGLSTSGAAALSAAAAIGTYTGPVQQAAPTAPNPWQSGTGMKGGG